MLMHLFRVRGLLWMIGLPTIEDDVRGNGPCKVLATRCVCTRLPRVFIHVTGRYVLYLGRVPASRDPISAAHHERHLWTSSYFSETHLNGV